MKPIAIILSITFLIIHSSCDNKLKKAQKEYENGQYVIALKLLENDNSIDAKILKSNALFEIGDFKGSINVFSDIDLNLDTVNYLRARGYFKISDYNNSIKILEQLLKNNPNYYQYSKALVKAYNNANKYKELYDISNRSLKIFPDSMIFHLGKASALEQFGDIVGSNTIYNFIIDKSTNKVYQATALRFLAYNTQDYELKKTYLLKAYNIDSSDPNLKYDLAEIYLEEGESAKGCKILRDLLNDNTIRTTLSEEILELIVNKCN